MSSLSTLPKGDSAWLLRKSIQRIMQQVSVLETNIGSSTTGNSANTQVIFNDNGTLRGDTGLTFNKTTDTLGTGRLTTSGDAIVCSSTGDFYVGTTLSPQFKVERATGSATITGDLTVDTSTLKVDSANDRVTVGTLSAYGRLTVGVGSGLQAGTTTNVAAGLVDIDYATTGDINTRLSFVNSNGATNAAIDRIGNPNFNDNGNLAFLTKAGAGSLTERMRITADGNVGIGVTPSAWQSSWKALDIGLLGGISYGFGETNITSNVYRLNTGASRYKAAGSAATVYAQVTGSHIFYTAGVAANANDPITFTQAMTLNANGALALQGGNASANGVGIAFPATQVASSDANTLDDYEEGTFTPTLTFGGASVGVVYVNQIGIYTKVGRIVHFSGRIDLSSKGSSTGDALITGLPFAGNTGAASVGYQNLTAPSDKQLMLTIDGTALYPRYASGTTTVQSTNSDFGNSTIIIFAGTFAV